MKGNKVWCPYTICSKRENGGLGVWRLRKFNFVLLGKWCGRIIVENRSLWYKVTGEVWRGGR